MDKVELLAPAGDFQTALAAFEAGADAVYCGLADFSARAFATNLSFEDLENLLAYAHARTVRAPADRRPANAGREVTPGTDDGRKVYVTFNTLLDEDQFDGAIDTLARLEEIGPDGVIVQDLGVAKLIRDHFPALRLHASTQLVAHNLEGVLALGELGFTRIVLARELSLEEISSIAKRCGDLELEVFIHGALCYSLSGLCLFGAMEKGRSGNRGKCPYCCRQAFKAKVEGEGERRSSIFCASLSEEGAKHLVSALPSAPNAGAKVGDEGVAETSCGRVAFQNKDGDHHCSPSPFSSFHHCSSSSSPSPFASPSYPFSMKDLRLGEDAKKLVEAGVASLKIEGRMKSPLYVASVTKYYRDILDGRPGRVSVQDLETVFSRRTTELYLNGSAHSSTNRQLLTTDNSSPIDAESLGHLGAEVGVVKKVTRDREGRAWLRFHTCRGLEKHDGLQFEAMTDEGRHLGMGIVEMRQAISRRPVFEVNAGVDVEVLVNEDVERALQPGMKIYCSMSNAVKRLFPTPSFRPSDYAGGKAIDVEVTIGKEGVSVLTRQECRVSSGEDGQGRRDIPVACKNENLQLSPAKDPSRTVEGVRKAFSKLGGTGYRLGGLTVNDPEKLFVPMSVLNDLRRDLVEALDAQRERALSGKIESAKSESFEPDRTVRAPADRVSASRVKIRAGQAVPAGDWSEVIVAITPETEVSQPSTFNLQPSTCRLALPVYTSELAFNKLRSAVKRLLRAGYAKWEAGDLATLRMLKGLGVTDVTADWTLYALNARALAVLSALGVRRFVASPENGRENLQYLAESGFDIEFLSQQSTPLFISLTRPEGGMENGEWKMESGLTIFRRDGLWVTTKSTPRTFETPEGVSTRVDLSWDV